MARQMMVGNWVTAHLASGDAPALVTRANPDGTVSLTVFAVGDTLYRDMVPPYEPDPEDEPEDKIGFFS